MGKIWSFGIFSEEEGFDIEKNKPQNLIKLFCSRQIRVKSKHPHTLADPFLYVHNDELYVFAEIEEINREAYINCWKTSDLNNWIDLGPVLSLDCHISYPYIFNDNAGNIYLIPETRKLQEVSIWKFDDFPFHLTKVNSILKGDYYDSNIFYRNNYYYLVTAYNDKSLKIFYSPDLLGNNWVPHPANQMCLKSKAYRNGGSIVYGNTLYRVAQDFQNGYGKKVCIYKIRSLDNNKFEEELITEDFSVNGEYKWLEEGKHHVSAVKFKNRIIIALDGLGNDYKINRLLNGLFRLVNFKFNIYILLIVLYNTYVFSSINMIE